jgi:hypothetical protein
MDDAPSATAVQEEVQGEGLPPRRKHRATKGTKAQEPQEPEEPKPQEPKPRAADPMLFAMLLATQRQMEKEARHAKISSLRIC